MEFLSKAWTVRTLGSRTRKALELAMKVKPQVVEIEEGRIAIIMSYDLYTQLMNQALRNRLTDELLERFEELEVEDSRDDNNALKYSAYKKGG